MVLRRHGHRREHGRRRCRAVRRSGGARVVLAASPRQSNPRVSDRVALHLVDGHLGGVSLDKLDESASLSGRNLDVGDFSKALEEGTELVLGDVSGKASDKDGRVVGVCELVHGLGSSIVSHRGSTHGVHSHGSGGTGHGRRSTGPALRGGGRNAHGTVAAVDTLHLGQGAVLILLVRESDKSVSARHSADGVGHNLGRLARRESRLEERDEDVFVDFRAEITDKDGVLGSAVVAGRVSV